MNQKAMKPVTVLTCFLLTGLLPGTLLHADAPIQNADIQKHGSDDLSWPKDKLLRSSYRWEKTLETYKNAVRISAFDPNLPDAKSPSADVYSVDLSGEWYATAIPLASLGSAVETFEADCDAALKEARYASEYVSIPDKHVVVGHELPPLKRSNATPSVDVSWIDKSYIKRVGPNIRVIIISHLSGLPNVRSNFQGIRDLKVFISDITPLEQILKRPQLGLDERRTNSINQ